MGGIGTEGRVPGPEAAGAGLTAIGGAMRSRSGAFVFEMRVGHLTLPATPAPLPLHLIIKQTNQTKDAMGSPGDPDLAQKPTPSETGSIHRRNPEPFRLYSQAESGALPALFTGGIRSPSGSIHRLNPEPFRLYSQAESGALPALFIG